MKWNTHTCTNSNSLSHNKSSHWDTKIHITNTEGFWVPTNVYLSHAPTILSVIDFVLFFFIFLFYTQPVHSSLFSAKINSQKPKKKVHSFIGSPTPSPRFTNWVFNRSWIREPERKNQFWLLEPKVKDKIYPSQISFFFSFFVVASLYFLWRWWVWRSFKWTFCF